jgi:hypothetical protein
MFAVGGDLQEGFGRGPKEHAVNYPVGSGGPRVRPSAVV